MLRDTDAQLKLTLLVYNPVKSLHNSRASSANID